MDMILGGFESRLTETEGRFVVELFVGDVLITTQKYATLTVATVMQKALLAEGPKIVEEMGGAVLAEYKRFLAEVQETKKRLLQQTTFSFDIETGTVNDVVDAIIGMTERIGKIKILVRSEDPLLFWKQVTERLASKVNPQDVTFEGSIIDFNDYLVDLSNAL